MFTGLEYPGSPKKHCNVCIVPTSMHFPSNFAFVLPFHGLLQHTSQPNMSHHQFLFHLTIFYSTNINIKCNYPYFWSLSSFFYLKKTCTEDNPKQNGKVWLKINAQELTKEKSLALGHEVQRENGDEGTGVFHGTQHGNMIAATCDMYQYLSRCPIIISSTARNDNNNTDTHVHELRDPSVISLINYTVHPEPHIFLQGDQTHIRICMVNKMLKENHKNK